MTGVVTWPALMFIAGLLCGAVIGTVAWTYWFWELIDRRIEKRMKDRNGNR